MEAVARLRNYPTSPRKMRLLADLIRGVEVEQALNTLKFSTKHPSVPLEKLLLSAVANWRVKNEGVDVVEAALALTRAHPEVTTLVLECTNMPPYAEAVASATGKRVEHIVSLIEQRWRSLA